MTLLRRSYVFLASAVALQAVTWSLVSVIRNLAEGGGGPQEALAFQIAVVVIGLPIYLFHWRWAERLAASSDEERASPARRLYLYGMLALFLIPFLANGFSIAAAVLRAPLPDVAIPSVGDLTDVAGESISAMVVLGALWLYHWRLVKGDRRDVGETGRSALIRRTYALGFSALGLAMSGIGFIQLIEWLLMQVGSPTGIWVGSSTLVAGEIARLVVGVPLWIVAWRWVDQLAVDEVADRDSALRFFFLYAALFVVVIVGLSHVAMIIAGGLQRVLGLPPEGDIRQVLPVVIVLAVGWAYFAAVLRRDSSLIGDEGRRAGLQRLYRYLVGGVGLAAFLFGFGGLLGVVVSMIGSGGEFTDPLREQLAWSTALLVVGIVIWIPTWRQLQERALGFGEVGAYERASIVRKAYLYFFLFLATVTVLSSAVYVVARLIMWMLGSGEAGELAGDLSRSISYGLVGVGVWLYHGLVLRQDGQRQDEDLAAKLGSVRAIVLDDGDGSLGAAVVSRLKEDLPGLDVSAHGLSTEAAVGMGVAYEPERAAEEASQADVVVAPWSMLMSGEAAEVLRAASGQRVLIPQDTPQWSIAGLEQYEEDELVVQARAAVLQIALGDDVEPVKPLGAGVLIAIAIGLVALLILVGMPIIAFLTGGGLGLLLE